MNCPKCDAIIYSRRSARCGTCGEALPDELLFTNEQRKQLEAQRDREQRAHRDALSNMDTIADRSIEGGYDI